jgi:D-3-phosphoglycerate dehydrogenase
LGRDSPGGDAIALIQVDGIVPEELMEQIRALPQVTSAAPLSF